MIIIWVRSMPCCHLSETVLSPWFKPLKVKNNVYIQHIDFMSLANFTETFYDCDLGALQNIACIWNLFLSCHFEPIVATYEVYAICLPVIGTLYSYIVPICWTCGIALVPFQMKTSISC